MHLGDSKASPDILNSYSGGGFDLFSLETGRTELAGKGHGKTAGMSGADQFFRIGAGFLAESFGERITNTGKYSALRRHSSFPVLQTTSPNSRSFALHKDRIVWRTNRVGKELFGSAFLVAEFQINGRPGRAAGPSYPGKHAALLAGPIPRCSLHRSL